MYYYETLGLILNFVSECERTDADFWVHKWTSSDGLDEMKDNTGGRDD